MIIWQPTLIYIWISPMSTRIHRHCQRAVLGSRSVLDNGETELSGREWRTLHAQDFEEGEILKTIGMHFGSRLFKSAMFARSQEFILNYCLPRHVCVSNNPNHATRKFSIGQDDL